jgi:hypothetical protein
MVCDFKRRSYQMKIKHKYLRNRRFRIKNWKKIRNTEHPFNTTMPWFCWGYPDKGENLWSTESQIQWNFEWIERGARRLESGSHKGSMNSAPAHYRRTLNAKRKAAENHTLQKIRNGDYDADMPTFRNDAAWLYW